MRLEKHRLAHRGREYLSLALLLGFLCSLTPVFASTSGIDATLSNALSAVNSAPLIVRQVGSTTADSNGQTNLDCLRVLQPRDSSSPYTYIGVYHRQTASNPFKVGLAGSNDLRTWTIINSALDSDWVSQADIARLPDGSYLVIYEYDPSAYDTSRSANPTWRIRHYPNYSSLASGSADRQFDFDNLLSSTHCAEGTPNFRKIVSYGGSVDNSVIEIGHHYCNYDSNGQVSATKGVPDSAARGTLINFRLWRTQDFTALNTAMRSAGVSQVGQMSTFQFRGNTYTLLEGQTIFGDFGSFKLFIYNEDSNYLQKLSVTTPGGSYSIANPRLGIHYDSSGKPDGIIGTYALLYASSPQCNGKCPGTNEGGTFLFQQNLDNTLADGIANPTNFAFRYNPNFAICNNGCQGIFLAGRDNLNAGTGTTTDIGGVSASVGGGQRHIIYGPYVTTLPTIPLTAVFRMKLDSVANAKDHVARIEVSDATSNAIIASRELYRSNFDHAYNNADLLLPFDWSGRSGHQAEFRVWTYDISYIKVAAVGVYLTSYTLYCPGDLSISGNAHSTGSSCISNSPSTSGNLVYGPYYFDFPGRPTVATFSLRASALSTSGSNAVASIDVHAFNPSGKEAILASMNINANQVDGTYRTFQLSYDTTFYTGAGWSIETRVNGLGKGNIEVQWTNVTPRP